MPNDPKIVDRKEESRDMLQDYPVLREQMEISPTSHDTVLRLAMCIIQVWLTFHVISAKIAYSFSSIFLYWWRIATNLLTQLTFQPNFMANA